MAEDREPFRDLLDRIGQPYAPSSIVEGATDASGERRPSGRSLEIGLPAIIRPAFTLGGTGGGIVETEAAYWERVRAGLRASPIKQVMVERCLVGWQEIEYEVMRDADDTCIAVCSMENVDPLGVHTGDSIVVAPVQTLHRPGPPAAPERRARDHPRRSASRAAATSSSRSRPTRPSTPSSRSTRASRARRALASKATGYPIARVAAQIAVGRTLAEIPNVVTGTTVAAFEPALDYVVVKLPRFPFDKFPSADRTPRQSQMKATGEVMAIDRTFGSALNKALRGLEQAGAGPLAEDPSWQADARLPRGGLAATGRGRPRTTPSPRRGHRSAGSTSAATACESTRFAQRSAAPIVLRRFLAPSDSRLWRCSALLRRGRPGGGDPGGDRHRAVVPGRDGPQRRARGATSRATGAAAGRRGGRRRRGAARHGRSGPGSAIAIWRRWPASRAPTSASGARGARPAARATRWSTPAPRSSPPRRRTSTATYAAAGSPPEAPPVPRPAALVIGSGPVRIGQGIEFDYCAVQAADTLREAGWSAVMVNSNPETVSTDFDASTRLYFEPLDAESVRSVIDAEAPDRADGSLPAMVAFGGQTPLNLAAPLAAARRAAAGQRPRGDRPGRGADPLRGAPRPPRHPAARGRHGAQRRGGADARRAHRLPGHRPAHRSSSAGSPSTSATRPRTSSASSRPRRSSTRTGRSASTATSRASRSTSTPSATARRCSSRASSSTSSGPASTRATRSASSRRRRVSRGRPGLIVATMERIVLALGAQRPGQRAVHRPRRRGLPHRGQPARVADGAVPVQGHRRADGRARGPDRARGDARGARLGRRPAASRRRSSRSRRRRSRRRSCAASTRRSGRTCSRPARSSASHADPRVALAKALTGASLRARRGPVRRRRSRSRCCPSPTATSAALAGLAAALYHGGLPAGGDPGHARARSRAHGYESSPVAKLGAEPDAAAGEAAILDAHRGRPRPARREHADAAIGRRSATPPRSATPRSPRGSCASPRSRRRRGRRGAGPGDPARIAEVRALTEWVPEVQPLAAASA